MTFKLDSKTLDIISVAHEEIAAGKTLEELFKEFEEFEKQQGQKEQQ
jgi:hypothetical protein